MTDENLAIKDNWLRTDMILADKPDYSKHLAKNKYEWSQTNLTTQEDWLRIYINYDKPDFPTGLVKNSYDLSQTNPINLVLKKV